MRTLPWALAALLAISQNGSQAANRGDMTDNHTDFRLLDGGVVRVTHNDDGIYFQLPDRILAGPLSPFLVRDKVVTPLPDNQGQLSVQLDFDGSFDVRQDGRPLRRTGQIDLGAGAIIGPRRLLAAIALLQWLPALISFRGLDERVAYERSWVLIATAFTVLALVAYYRPRYAWASFFIVGAPYVAQTILFARNGHAFTLWFALSAAISIVLIKGFWAAWIHQCDVAYVRKVYRKRAAISDPDPDPVRASNGPLPPARGMVSSWWSDEDSDRSSV